VNKVFFIVLTICVMGYLLANGTKIEPELPQSASPYAQYVGYVNEIREALADEMFEELGLIPAGDRGMMHEKVEEIGMEFTTPRRATVEEARALHLYVMERFVQTINAHEKIQPFLEERPFTYKRVTISIEFEGPNGTYNDESVGRIWNVPDDAVIENRNHLMYYTYDAFKFHSDVLFKEPYEEAVKLAEASTVRYPFVHQKNPMEEAVDQALLSFRNEMFDNYDFGCWAIEAKLSDSIEEVRGYFSLVQRVTQQEARAITLRISERLIQVVNEKLSPYLKEQPFSANRLKLRVKFTKRNGYSYHDGSVASVLIVKDELTYFKKLPPTLLSYPPEYYPFFAKESYQVAMEQAKNKISPRQR
jgi:hypothetical protein